MKLVKTALISTSVAACSLAASSAFAAGFTANGLPNGTSKLTGNTQASLSPFPPVPCVATFNVQATSGVGTVTSASFAPPSGSTSTACNAITACSTPWALTAIGAINTTNNVRVNACVRIPALNATCTGVVTGTLRASGSANNFTFGGSLGVCTVNTTSSTGLVNGTYATVGIVFP